ncbi:YkgJ family cysteine cluster protein [Arcobacter sp.]|uniref:YkgJ family cysteine cluster protein n=1 Tax=unclassified Arcobacter TaxID=2593671 RepID=UPI003B001A3A|eukprot:TRINITY_DN35607_c0_g2_i1.p1 TRINITY_DN35607_c0_g2~~TRINITY_DN35607_c0_g2_i1.p1  ORF type:complete len:252 (-),score=-70.29 TRINITY_DN35607_c0_g2_i1:99-854(-)
MSDNFKKANDIINKEIMNKSKISPTFEILESIEKIAFYMKDENHYFSTLYTVLSPNYYKSFDKRIKKATTNEQFACDKGCSHCCKRLKIGFPVLEIDYIVDYLNELDDDKKEVIAINLNSLEEKDRDKKINKREYIKEAIIEQESTLLYDCPFLIDDVCSIYEARPMICRTYLSKSFESCYVQGTADNVLDNIYGQGYHNLLKHDNNIMYTVGLPINANFPFFAIKHGNNKFYSLNKYNKFLDFIQHKINK